MKRDRIAIVEWNRNDFATIGVPVDDSGNEVRSYLRRQEIVGECRLEWTGHVMLHEDNRQYEDVAIHSTHRTDPQEIAAIAAAYLPDGQEIGIPCIFCQGKGCRDCGNTGIQAAT